VSLGKLVEDYKAKRPASSLKSWRTEKGAFRRQWKETNELVAAQNADDLEENPLVNYSKSDEFQNQYEAPYKNWDRAMGRSW